VKKHFEVLCMSNLKEIIEDMRYDSCWVEWELEQYGEEPARIFRDFIENYLKELSALAYGLNGEGE